MIYLKNKLSKFTLILISIFCTLNLQAQLTADITPKGDRDVLEDKSTWVEVVSKRNVFSSTYKTPDNRLITHYSKQPLNYYNYKKELVPINKVPTTNPSGLTASDQPNAVSLLLNGAVMIQTNNGSPIIYSENCKINGTPISFSQIKNNGVNSTMQSNITGLTKTFEHRFNALKYNYVLKTPIINGNNNLIIEEDITMPKGSKVQPDYNYGKKDKNGWTGSLVIVSDKDEKIGSIQGAVCYDANNNSIVAAYQYKKVNGIQKLKIIVPKSWINNPSRVYPITIDPLVTGPLSTFGGPTIPSCISPLSGSDSIQVTIPANVSVTGVFVSGSFYANPFTTAIMNDGAMYFSSSCGTSNSYTTTAPAGLSPGTAYLTATNLNNPLLCCVPQSCTSQTFYLTMHVTRTVGGTGCNATYIYHNPTSAYPFEAYVEGRTIESFGPIWSVSPTTVCSDECDLTSSVFIKYGVPPFTVTHPWMPGSITAGNPSGCSTSTQIVNLSLTNPNCPWYCDTITSILVPAPTVIDACGDSITGLLPFSIGINETPTVTASPDTITICSGESFNTTITPCLPTSVVNWSGNSNSGTGTSISEVLTNTSSTVSTTIYQVSADNSGCQSDTISVIVNTVPLPLAGFTITPSPVIVSSPAIFKDNSTIFGNNVTNWLWAFGDGNISNDQNPIHTYTEAGTFTVCLTIGTEEGCIDTICEDIVVIPAELELPNVVTPNDDGMNDILYFKYLEFLGTNSLQVFNRWGQLMFEQNNYKNDWAPKDLVDGTYYYVLTVQNGETFTSFLEIINK